MSTTIPTMFFVTTVTAGVTPGPWAVLMSPLVTVITVLNPLTTIAFMRCYRQVALRHLFSWTSAIRKLLLEQQSAQVGPINECEHREQ